MQISIIYEDSDLIVVNKPAGLVVNQSQTARGDTLQSWFETHFFSEKEINNYSNWSSLVPDEFDQNYGQPSDIFRQRGGIVHRLDKQTSGVLVLAKNPGSLLNLMNLLFKRKE